MKQSEGEARVRVSFNPSENSDVDKVKLKTAELIDMMADIAADRTDPGARNASLAMTSYEEAAMWAVKALTATPNE